MNYEEFKERFIEEVKEKLAMEIVSAEANAEMLENVPHKNMEDMAVVYRFVLNTEERQGIRPASNKLNYRFNDKCEMVCLHSI